MKECDGRARSGHFYILAEKDTCSSGQYTGYYKVGTTKDLAATKSELQISNPKEEYEVNVPDMDAAERTAYDAVRRKYQSDPMRGNGWYNIPRNRDDFLMMIKFAVTNKHVQKYQGVIQKLDED